MLIARPMIELYLAHRDEAALAVQLIESHGVGAAVEAAARADRSRAIGNHVHFCRWRQVARLIDWLGTDRGGGTLH